MGGYDSPSGSRSIGDFPNIFFGGMRAVDTSRGIGVGKLIFKHPRSCGKQRQFFTADRIDFLFSVDVD